MSTTTRKECKAFTIDRSKWARLGLNGDSEMLNDQGAMCCLGFYAKACGAEDHELAGVTSPARVCDRTGARDVIPYWLIIEGSYGIDYNSDLGQALMSMNDHANPYFHERTIDESNQASVEAFIKETFARQGVDVDFVDGADATSKEAA